jgi:hypothetical protein
MFRLIKNYFTESFKTKCLLCFFAMKKYSIIFLLYLLVLPIVSNANTEKNLEYKVKAAYLYNFTKFITWPEKTFSSSGDGNLNICVLGKDPFGHAIDLLSNKVAKGHAVIIEYIDDIKSAAQCHVIFISKSEEKNINSIIEDLSTKNILTVSDIDGFAVKGGCISLGVLRGKVRFNVNLQATYSADLKISAKLLELAKVVIE